MITKQSGNISRIRKVIQSIAKEDFRVFLACLTIAILLWLFNALNEERTEIISYPIEFEYDKKKYVALQDFPKTISFNITANGWQVMWRKIGIGNETIKYSLKHPIDLSKSEIPSSRLRRSIIRVLEHAKLGDIMTETIPVIMDRRIRRRFKLKIDSTKIPLPEGYRIVSPVKISPSIVTLDGSENQIRALESPFELKVNNVKVNDYVDLDVPIRIRKFKKPIINKSIEKVKVSFGLAKFITRKISIPVDKVNFPKKSKYYLNKKQRFIQVEYTFKESDKGRIRLSQFEIEADFKSFNEDKKTIELRLKKSPKYILKNDIKFPRKLVMSYRD